MKNTNEEQKTKVALDEHPLQERDCHPGSEGVAIAATHVFAGRLTRIRDKAGQPYALIFVP